MSTATDERTDLEIIEGLDFEHVPACEHGRHNAERRVHDGPAYALVWWERNCANCGTAGAEVYLCRPYVAACGRGDLMNCGNCGIPAPYAFQVIALVKP